MNHCEIAVLRTKLRAVNVEFSALVKGTAREGGFVSMGELRVKRRELMALIAEQRGREAKKPVDATSVKEIAVAHTVDRVLKGVKLSDSPVVQQHAFTPGPNLNAAESLGVSLPASLLNRADEVLR